MDIWPVMGMVKENWLPPATFDKTHREGPRKASALLQLKN